MATSGWGRQVAMLHSSARRGLTPCPTCRVGEAARRQNCMPSSHNQHPPAGIPCYAATFQRQRLLQWQSHLTMTPRHTSLAHQHCGLCQALWHIVHTDGQRGDQALTAECGECGSMWREVLVTLQHSLPRAGPSLAVPTGKKSSPALPLPTCAQPRSPQKETPTAQPSPRAWAAMMPTMSAVLRAAGWWGEGRAWPVRGEAQQGSEASSSEPSSCGPGLYPLRSCGPVPPCPHVPQPCSHLPNPAAPQTQCPRTPPGAAARCG